MWITTYSFIKFWAHWMFGWIRQQLILSLLTLLHLNHQYAIRRSTLWITAISIILQRVIQALQWAGKVARWPAHPRISMVLEIFIPVVFITMSMCNILSCQPSLTPISYNRLPIMSIRWNCTWRPDHHQQIWVNQDRREGRKSRIGILGLFGGRHRHHNHSKSGVRQSDHAG